MDGDERRRKVSILKARLMKQEAAVLSAMTPITRACDVDTYEQLGHTLQANRYLQQYAANLEELLAESNGLVDAREAQEIREHLDEYMSALYPKEWIREKQRWGQA